MRKCTKKLAVWLLVCMMVMSMLPVNLVEASTEADKKTTVAKEEEAAKKSTSDTKKSASNTKKTVSTKSRNAKEAIKEGIFQNREETSVDLSSYNLREEEAQVLTAAVLEENNASTLVNTTYEMDETGTVTTMSVDMDPSLAYAMDEVEEIADDSGESDDTDLQMQVMSHYAELQTLYSNNPEYFGVACPYFTSKDTESGPVTALLSLMQQQWPQEGETLESPDLNTVDQIVQGYTSTLKLCVLYLGSDLEAARNKALATIDENMSTIDKMLVLNDWLGNWSTFDMSSIQDMNEQQNGGNQDVEMEQALDTANETVALAENEQPSSEEIRYMLLKGDMASFVESTAFGALVRRNCLCIGYTAAYNYLIQWALDDVYKHEDGSWKSKEELNEGKIVKTDESGNPVKKDVLDSNGNQVVDALGNEVSQYVYETEETDEEGNPIYKTGAAYMVDFVKIFWNSDVQMLGEAQTFRNSHYFTAVNLGDQAKWYYIDSCYNDIYVECMGRNRVETDGNMVHSYFLVSQSTLESQFKDNYDQIETLYADKATDDTYEDAWFTKASGPISYDHNNWYYVQNTSTYDFSGSNFNYEEGSDQLVSRPRTTAVTSTGNETILIDYEDASKGIAESGNELVIEGAKADDENNEDYAGLMHTSAKYGDAIYLNVDNKILKYDLNSKAITKVKEYNKVSVVQDNENPFVGMSYTVVSEGTEGIVKTVKDKPLAAIAIKDDGKLYASIATNYCYVSDYAVEETNYNSEYMNYNFGGQHISNGGENDNQEFMWSANFVEILDMSHVTGSSHNYEAVVVEPTCTEKGYTEKRCTTCGISDGGERTDVTEAAGHHYLSVKDTTYTKDDNGNKIVVDANVCTRCLDSKGKLDEGETGEHVYDGVVYDWAEDNKSCKATFTCATCKDTQLDCTKDDKTIVQTADCEIKNEITGDCEQGGTAVYTATCTFKGKEYTDTKEVILTEGSAHVYGKPEFIWEANTEQGGYTCKAEFTCNNCQTKNAVDCTIAEPAEVPATCTEKGTLTYTASCTFNEKTYTDEKVDEIEALGHEYKEPEFEWTEKEDKTGYTCKAIFKCDRCDDVQSVDCDITSKATGNVCTEGGSIVYTATCTFEGKDYTGTKTVEVSEAQGHTYAKPVFEWAEDASSCNAIFKCEYGDDIKTVKCDITKQEKAATCDQTGLTTYTATCKFDVDGQKYTDTTEKEIPALGHKYGEPVFNWSNDGALCNAEFTCSVDKAKHTEKCTVSSKVTGATYMAEGSTVYTATCKLNDKAYNSTKIVAIPKLEAKAAFKKASYSVYATQTLETGITSNYKEDGIVSMKSSNTKILAVANDGRIKGVKAGKATIAATTKTGETIKATVTIKTPKVSLTTASAPLQLKKSTTAIKVKSKIASDAVSKWSTSNKKIATVNKSGKITAKKVGTVKITVTMKSGAKASCKVKVQKAAVKLTKLSINKSKVTLKLKGGTKTFKIATAKNPVTATNKVTFKSSNKKIATVSSAGKITAKKAGAATITVKCGTKTRKIKVTVKKK